MPTADAERLEWLGENTMRLLVAAVDRDVDEVARLIEEIAGRYDAQGMYGVCCALAETVRQFAFPGVPRGDGTLEGTMLMVQKLRDGTDPDALWSCRFVAAYVNGDHDTTSALFFGTIGDVEAHSRGVIALVALAADIARQRQEVQP